MNLYKLEGNAYGYDTYDSCVVCAATEADAKNITPDGYSWEDAGWDWAKSPEDVTATQIGIADPSIKEGTVVCASFNAG